jgi:hypothetical protein
MGDWVERSDARSITSGKHTQRVCSFDVREGISFNNSESGNVLLIPPIQWNKSIL